MLIRVFLHAEFFDKIGGNYVLSANSIKICLYLQFCVNFLRFSLMKTVQNPYRFLLIRVKNAKK